MKIIARVLLLLLNIVMSISLVLWGWYGPALADGTQQIQPVQLVIGLLIFPTLLLLLFLGKSNRKTERLFWYLGIGLPLLVILLAFTL